MHCWLRVVQHQYFEHKITSDRAILVLIGHSRYLLGHIQLKVSEMFLSIDLQLMSSCLARVIVGKEVRADVGMLTVSLDSQHHATNVSPFTISIKLLEMQTNTSHTHTHTAHTHTAHTHTHTHTHTCTHTHAHTCTHKHTHIHTHCTHIHTHTCTHTHAHTHTQTHTRGEAVGLLNKAIVCHNLIPVACMFATFPPSDLSTCVVFMCCP